LKSKSWNPAEPLVADVDFKHTTDKIVLLDLKRRYYLSGHLTDRGKRKILERQAGLQNLRFDPILNY